MSGEERAYWQNLQNGQRCERIMHHIANLIGEDEAKLWEMLFEDVHKFSRYIKTKVSMVVGEVTRD